MVRLWQPCIDEPVAAAAVNGQLIHIADVMMVPG